MGDRNRLKELMRSLDCQRRDAGTVGEIKEIVGDMLTESYEGSTGGNPQAFVFDAGAADQIHSLLVWLRPDVPVRDCQAAVDEILRLLE